MQICNFNIHSVESFSKINPCANGQSSCTVVTHKNGGTGEGGGTEERDLGLCNKKWDYNYCCRVSSRGNKQGSKLSVTKRKGFKQVEAKPIYVSKHLP